MCTRTTNTYGDKNTTVPGLRTQVMIKYHHMQPVYYFITYHSPIGLDHAKPQWSKSAGAENNKNESIGVHNNKWLHFFRYFAHNSSYSWNVLHCLPFLVNVISWELIFRLMLSHESSFSQGTADENGFVLQLYCFCFYLILWFDIIWTLFENIICSFMNSYVIPKVNWEYGNIFGQCSYDYLSFKIVSLQSAKLLYLYAF